MQGNASIAGTSAWALVAVLPSVSFVVLLLVSRVLVPLRRLAAAAGILPFGFCVLARRDQIVPMWAGAVLAYSSVAFELALGAAVRALAPDDVVVISEV